MTRVARHLATYPIPVEKSRPGRHPIRRVLALVLLAVVIGLVVISLVITPGLVRAAEPQAPRTMGAIPLRRQCRTAGAQSLMTCSNRGTSRKSKHVPLDVREFVSPEPFFRLIWSDAGVDF